MKEKLSPIYFVLCLILSAACGTKNYEEPTQATPINEAVSIFPDYTGVVVPPNIAPLNFMVRSTGDNYVAVLKCGKEKMISGAGKSAKIQFEPTSWKSFLTLCKGKTIEVSLYIEREGKWSVFPKYKMDVAEEPIDEYLSYRLIEPGYELYRQVGLYQRNLTNFDVQTIYENNRAFNRPENHCVNCHNYQNYSTKRMLFHVRAAMGGIIFAEGGKITKMNLKNDSILSSSVYPSWHPTKDWVVFSSNQTGQIFHILDTDKIEVLDYGSDLIFYNVGTHEISNILKTPADLETFPCWNPAGDRVYYCVAHREDFLENPDSTHSKLAVQSPQKFLYNIMSIPFDTLTMTFGAPQMEVPCTEIERSASVPRISPDGRYLLFTLGKYGQFHIWHKSADLYVKDLQTGYIYPLVEANSSNVDSYHSWSSNGRWIVFSSRRDDGSFTRPYFTYFDKNGKSHKAFMLPQEDPEHNIMLFKSYNVPELTKDAVPFTCEQFREAIYNQEGDTVAYKEIRKF